MAIEAFMIGLIGSFHCIGMCGPIAVMLPYQSSSKWQSMGNIVLYNLGRITTYSFLGLLLGMVGRGIALAGFQQGISIVIGVFILGVVFFSWNVDVQLFRVKWLQKLRAKVNSALGQLLQNPRPSSLYLIGLLNGLLPCGFVYLGLTGAVTSHSLLEGMLYMTFFGIGTTPMLFFAALGSRFISTNFRTQIQRLAPVFMVVFAVLFILRGMNLGIPYVSPHLSSEEVKLIICH